MDYQQNVKTILFDSAQAVLNQLGLPKSAYDVTQRDAIFIRATLWWRGIRDGLVSLLVCMPVRRMVVYCIETAHRIKLFFLLRGFSRAVIHCVLRKFGYLQSKGTAV